MKIVTLNVREGEDRELEQWSKEHNDIDVDVYNDTLTLDNIDRVNGADAISLAAPGNMGADILGELHDRGVDVIAQRSVGFDMYDMDAVNDLGMALITVPTYSPNAIAEYVVATALYLSRNLNTIYKNVQNQDFRWNIPILSKEMPELTVGIVGTGHIGQAAAKLFKGLGAHVIGYNHRVHDELKDLFDFVSLDELYAQSDIITFHIPATDDTYHMVDDDAIAKMKDGVILINAARGAIVDTEALIRGLDSHKIKAAGIDVYENEDGIVNRDNSGEDLNDPIYDELIKRDDIAYTPHLAFYTETALHNMIYSALDEAVKYLETGESDAVVNK
ncbi:D-2-hydroxyacid dehydrogenase [Aerococcus vaginalis]